MGNIIGTKETNSANKRRSGKGPGDKKMTVTINGATTHYIKIYKFNNLHIIL